jgi:trans-L-3-hydroxyproline dehydratase
MPYEIHTTEMHTGGEPVRIVESGYPVLEGATILDKRRDAREHHDHLRRALMLEPRGHADMYGVIPVGPDNPEADIAVLFMHNEGYSTMCGHAVLALARWAVDSGRMAAHQPATDVAIQVPSGLVRANVDFDGERTGAARFLSVPSFVAAADVTVAVAGRGDVTFDVAYGGAFYALVPAGDLGLDLTSSPVSDVIDAAWAVTGAAAEQVPLHHPDDPDLAFLYGTIVTDGVDTWSEEPTRNVCVFADRQVDRSPTGSGVQARIAAMRSRGMIELGQERRFESLTGAVFTGKPVAETFAGDVPAVVVEVGGHAHYTGRAAFTMEEGDGLEPFLLR